MLTTDRDPVLLERLNRHPQMRARMESLLAVVEDAAGDGERADAAERRMIAELRQMGHEALTAWAERGVEKQTQRVSTEPDWRPDGKKNGPVNFPVMARARSIGFNHRPHPTP